MDKIKIGILSDLHTEFWTPAQFKELGGKVQQQLADADLILLAGDIDVGTRCIQTVRDLFTQPICLIAGNHEFYHREHDQTVTALVDLASGTNINFLHRECYTTHIKERNIRVLGVTLWTDFALFGTPVLSMLHARRILNDFRFIRHFDGALLIPEDTVVWHQQDKAWLLAELDRPFDGLTIVMTHHAPFNIAVSPRFVNDPLSPCFVSRLEAELIRDDIALVVWGHTHHSVDQTIGKTRLISHQSGYATSLSTTETNDFGLVIDL